MTAALCTGHPGRTASWRAPHVSAKGVRARLDQMSQLLCPFQASQIPNAQAAGTSHWQFISCSSYPGRCADACEAVWRSAPTAKVSKAPPASELNADRTLLSTRMRSCLVLPYLPTLLMQRQKALTHHEKRLTTSRNPPVNDARPASTKRLQAFRR